MMKKLSKTLALLLALTMVLCLAACGGSKDALSGTWSADLGDDGVITWRAGAIRLPTRSLWIAAASP